MVDFATLHPLHSNLVRAAARLQTQLCRCYPRFTQLLLVGLLVATLGGGSLLCIVHCHLVRLLAPPSVTVYGITLSLCHSPLDPSDPTPPPLDPTLFYGVQLTPLPMLWLLIVQLLATLHPLLPRMILTCAIPPDPPPPRSA